MSHADFVHLRVHTAYSLSEGAIHVKDLAALCEKHAMPAVAMTDSANMFGALEFSEVMCARGVQPIIGVTLPLAQKTAPDAAAAPAGGRGEQRPEIVLLAQNETGYRNLMKLVSKAHLAPEAHEGAHIALADLEESGRTDGLILLTGGAEGPLGRLLCEGQVEKASALLSHFESLFPGRVYIELQRHGLAEEEMSEPGLLELAYDRNVPLVATNRCFFPDAAMYDAHDALLCIAEGKYVASVDRRRLTPDHGFKSAAEMRTRFADLPEAIENTLVIAQRTAFRVPKRAPILPRFASEDGEDEAAILRRMALDGLGQRLAALGEARAAPVESYRERLDYELSVIIEMGFAGYFLIVADFIQWAKDNGVPVGPGRGSGAGSLVAWALRITDLDPLRFSLLFERFLNPERVSMPDFDIDFCQDKRERVIRYVQQKYGSDQVAQIITFGKLQARAVLRDVGRVLQQPYPVTDRLCKMIPNNPADPKTLAEALAEEPRLREAIRSDPQTAEVIDRALKLEGLYRHASTHAAGVVIGDRPLDELVPLYRDPRSPMPVTQFNMKWVEQAGLVKFDFLGLKTLTVIDRALAHIRKRGIEIDIARIPFDDKRTFDMLAAGDTAGVFQLESSGMRAMLKGLRPDCFEDIIAIVALFRPGPMDNIPTYIARKHGREDVVHPHPLIAPVLEETYGIPVYQEQVMQIAQILAGYSLGEADLLRRAMGKKIASEMDEQRERFVRGARKKDVPEAKAHEIFDLLAKFAGYGFNKSHAAAYALVAWQTAWLKANYPVEFMAASMSLDIGNTDKLAQFKKELARMAIPLLPPDINRSGADFTVERVSETQDPDDPRAGLGVRYALAAVRNVGAKAMESLVEAREAAGPFRDPFDLSDRLDPRLLNKRQIEQLAAAGAFDSIAPDRASVHASAELLMRHANISHADRESDQASLFDSAPGDGGLKRTRPSLEQVEPWPEAERLARELGAIGFYLSAHPLDGYRKALHRLRTTPASELGSDRASGSLLRMAGVIDSFSERKSRKSGKRFGIMQLSDPSGSFEIMIFEDGLEHARALAERGEPVLADVEVRRRDEDDEIRLSARRLASLEAEAAQTGAGLDIDINGPEGLPRLRDLLERHLGGRGQIALRMTLRHGGEARIDLADGYRVTPGLAADIRMLPGIAAAEET
ncbi:MAG: DNA polymerase III subunit alpha [Rhodothalassiaceae bacterium]